MKNFRWSLVFVFAGLVLPAFGADDYGIFKVTLSVQASRVIVHEQTADTVDRKELGTADFVNLALGQPLGTKIDPKKAVLAAAATFEEHGEAPKSKLIIFDPSQDGVNQVKVVVSTITSLVFQNAYGNSRNSGFGYGSGSILATTLGAPALNGFLASPIQLFGSGGGVHLNPQEMNKNAKPMGVGRLLGSLKFVVTNPQKNTTETWDSIITRGTVTLSGKMLGSYRE